MKQTAVEWLIVQIKNDHIDKALTGLEWIKIFEQAKEMEKQQIIDTFDAGLFDGTMDDINDRMHKHYYNETYGSKGSDEQRIYGDHTIQILEISDEDIEEYAKKNSFQYYEFITGAKWYREQLKQK